MSHFFPQIQMNVKEKVIHNVFTPILSDAFEGIAER